MDTREIVKALEGDIRHKNGSTGDDFVKHYTEAFAPYAYATHDGSWNQLEKQITHVLGMSIYQRRLLEILGFDDGDDGLDPRELVWEYDAAEKVLDEIKKKIVGSIGK